MVKGGRVDGEEREERETMKKKLGERIFLRFVLLIFLVVDGRPVLLAETEDKNGLSWDGFLNRFVQVH